MKTVMIDVDLTLVDTLSPWLRWFKARTGIELEANTYELSTQMAKYMIHECPMSYWREKGVYEGLMPYPASTYTVRKLVDNGFRVVFVTWSPYPDQIAPKEQWLTKHYGNDIPVIHTEHKHLIDADIMIDDNPKMLSEFLEARSGRVALKYDTRLNQNWSAPYGKKSLTMRSWDSVQEYFTNYEGVQFK